MILIRLKDGRQVTLEGTDLLVITRLAHVPLTFEPADVEMIDVAGELSVLDGHATGTTDPVRGLLFTDAETGIRIQIVMPLANARELADHLGRGKIIPVRSFP